MSPVSWKACFKTWKQGWVQLAHHFSLISVLCVYEASLHHSLFFFLRKLMALFILIRCWGWVHLQQFESTSNRCFFDKIAVRSDLGFFLLIFHETVWKIQMFNPFALRNLKFYLILFALWLSQWFYGSKRNL